MYAHKSQPDSKKNDDDGDGDGDAVVVGVGHKSKRHAKRTLIFICTDCQSNAAQTHTRKHSTTYTYID